MRLPAKHLNRKRKAMALQSTQQMDRISGSDERNEWGLKVPGRPPTPSEGAAQLYNRVGPREQQKILTFDNGTCLTFGPLDRVDEWDMNAHPFVDQVAQIDKAIHEVKGIRDRYIGTEESESVFANFRSFPAPEDMVTEVTISGVVYKQVPSKHATLTNMVSVYTKVQKDENNSDTRYGTTGRPPLDAIPRFVPNGPNVPPGGPPAQRIYQRPDNSRARRVNRRAAGRDMTNEEYEDDGKSLAQHRFERRLAEEADEYSRGRGPFIGLGASLQAQGSGLYRGTGSNAPPQLPTNRPPQQPTYMQAQGSGLYRGTGSNPTPQLPTNRPPQQPTYMQSLQTPTYQTYAGYIVDGVEQGVGSALPPPPGMLRPSPGLETMNSSERQVRRPRSSLTGRDDDVLRVQQYIETANDVYAREGYPRVTFQPPTPNMQSSGVVLQNRAPELLDRPNSTDSGWCPPTIQRSPSGSNFHAAPTGLLSSSSRFKPEATYEPPLTADTQIWGTSYNQSSVPSRESSPAATGSIRGPSPSATGSIRGRRLYESGSQTSSRIHSPNDSSVGRVPKNERQGSGSSGSGPASGTPGSFSSHHGNHLGGNLPGSRPTSGRGQRNWM